MLEEQWDEILEPKKRLLDLNIKELLKSKDLISLLVRRDFVSTYKQTVLGPVWYIIQPLLTTLMFYFIFNKVANISTGITPPILYYLSGLILWNFFSQNVNNTSNTFINNAHIFGKVYFPRITVPIGIVISGLISLLIQFVFFLFFYLYYYFTGFELHLNFHLLIIPYLVLICALLSLGIGIIISALTTKYRDLRFLVQFGIQLAMYATPIIYPLMGLNNRYKFIIMLNPMSSLIEAFRFGFFGNGAFPWYYLAYSTIFSIFVLFIGILVFNKVERTFMDTI